MPSPVAIARPPRGYEISGHLAADVLTALAQHPAGVTPQDLATHLGVEEATARRAAIVLRSRGLVDSSAPSRPRGRGRPAHLVRLSTQHALLGFSISDLTDLTRNPTHHPGEDARVSRIVGCATTLTGHPLTGPAHEPLTLAEIQDVSKLAAAVARLARKIMTIGDLAPENILGLGVALGGVIIDGDAHRSCNLAWHGTMPVQQSLCQTFPDWAVAVENDANAVLTAHAWHPENNPLTPMPTSRSTGAGEPRDGDILFRQARQNLMAVLVRPEGIGGAVFANGNRVTGHRGAAGEIGHVKVREAAGLRCRCGGYGCLEAYAAPSRLMERMTVGNGTAKDFTEAARITKDVPGHGTAIRYFRAAGEVLGRQIAAAATWTDPSAILLYLPPVLLDAQPGTPGAAYLRALTAPLDDIYPSPPVVLLGSVDDADALAAQAVTTSAFNVALDLMRETRAGTAPADG